MRLPTLLSRVLPGAFFLVLLSSPAFAQWPGGIDLSWGDCGLYGRSSRNFACDSNSGEEVLIGSALTLIDLPQLDAMYAVIDLQSNQAVVSSWWQLGAGGCRQGALTSSFDFTTVTTSCLDAWSGAASGGILYGPQPGGTNTARIRIFCTTTAPVSITAGDEYSFFKLSLSHTKTTGTGSCAGCGDAVCLRLGLIELSDPSIGVMTLNSPLARTHVTWHNADIFCPPVDEPPVVTRSRTWGSVKGLYR